MTATPTVSVVLPVFNAERYVVPAIESILAQTWQDFELLVFDDGSSDGSPAAIDACTRGDTRCRVVSRENRGIVATCNEGVQLARGKYIARMDADDIALPQRLARQVAYLEAEPACVAVGSRVLLIDADDMPIAEMVDRFSHAEIDGFHLGGAGSVLFHPTVMMRREAVVAVGAYRPDFEWAEDYDLFLRLAEVGRLANLDEVLLHYRQHAGSVGYSKRQLQVERTARALAEACARRGLAAPGSAPVTALLVAPGPADFHRKWAWWALAAGNAATARKHAWCALRLAPLNWENHRALLCAMRGH